MSRSLSSLRERNCARRRARINLHPFRIPSLAIESGLRVSQQGLNKADLDLIHPNC